MRKLAFIMTVAVAGAGCGGGPLVSESGPSTVAPLSGEQPATTASFVVTIPARTAASRSRQPAYVAPTTQSIAIALNGAAPVSANLTVSTNSACSNATGNIVCTIPVTAPPGSNTFNVTLYNQLLDGSGNVPSAAKALSTGTVSATIVARRSNLIPITLNGIVASLTLAVNPNSTPARTAAQVPLIVTAKDADGNTIIGPGSYTAPITIASTDASGATSLSRTTVIDPSQSQIAIAVAATAPSGTVTFTASTQGVAAASATLAIAGGVAGFFSQGLSPSSAPQQITKGQDGNFWFSIVDNTGKIGVVTPQGAIVHLYVLPPFGNPNYLGTAPQAIAKGPASDPNPRLFFLTSSGIGAIKVSDGSIVRYPSPNNSPGYFDNGITLGPDGALWYTAGAVGGCIGRLDPLQPPSASNPTEFCTLLSPNARAGDITTGADGNLWFTEQDANKIGRYNLNGSGGGTIGTVTEFTVPTAASRPDGIVLASDGNIWFMESAPTAGAAGGKIGKITPAGAIIEFVNVGGRTTRGAQTMVATAEGDIFFAEDQRDGHLGRITTAGTITQLPFFLNGQPRGAAYLTLDAIGSLWFTSNINASGVGRYVY